VRRWHFRQAVFIQISNESIVQLCQRLTPNGVSSPRSVSIMA
jgi:hypothetical protein